MAHHTLRARSETRHLGSFDAALKPVLHVASDDEATIETVR